MDQAKLTFLQTELPELLKTLQPDTKARWGKMNAQQMVEHMTDFFKVSNNKLLLPVVTPEEHLPRYMAFLYSDKEFRENTQAPADIVPEEPVTERNSGLPEAISELRNEVNDFVAYFRDGEDKKTTHPVFGSLNYEEWVLLHYKHVTHHLRQFGLQGSRPW